MARWVPWRTGIGYIARLGHKRLFHWAAPIAAAFMFSHQPSLRLMAKSPIPPTLPNAASSTSGDDPLESVTLWLQQNAKMLMIGAAVLVVALGALFLFRASEATKRERASTALYDARTPLAEGRFDEARTALAAITQRYTGTSAAEQATLLLAQLNYDQEQFDEGIALLQEARGSASLAFAASIEALTAAGFEAKGDWAKAAEHYGKAANATALNTERSAFTLSQGRALMAAGERQAAIDILTPLAADETAPSALEARVRLGELQAQGS